VEGCAAVANSYSTATPMPPDRTCMDLGAADNGSAALYPQKNF